MEDMLRRWRRSGGFSRLARLALLLALVAAASAGRDDGTIVYSIGEVRVRKSETVTEAVPGQAVGQGDVVTTGRDGAAVIQSPPGRR